MCRIYGYLGNEEITAEILRNVANAQIHGGPDGQYRKKEMNWAIGNNRLAIQGLNGGIQPFSMNKIHAVYNGELYNYKELRNLLMQKGYTFEDDCDGAVILPLYELYGPDFVKYLDGMFAIAIVDTREKERLILASDSWSIKSVYYYWDRKNDNFYFSSELPALLLFPITGNLRPEAIDEYLIGRAIWHNKTFYRDIFSLGPAAVLIKEQGEPPNLYQYTSNIGDAYNKENKALSFIETAKSFDSLFDHEIAKIVQADVPVCVITSGGLDSSYITALAAKYVNNLNCFNIAYEGNWPGDEKSFANEVAQYCGAKYNQVIITEREFPLILAKTIGHLGQPNSAPHALSTYALFKAIHEEGFKVTITGEGADEFFGGYERFQKATFNHKPEWLEQYFDIICATTQKVRNDTYSEDYKNFLLSHHFQPLINAQKSILFNPNGEENRLKSLLRFDQYERFPSYILRRVDHLSMASAVEVRVPFCQPTVTTFANSLPMDYLVDKVSVKRLLYQSAQDKLPQSVLTRPKQPFTLPIVAMLRKGFVLFDIMHDTLHSMSFVSRNIFNLDKIEKLISKQVDEPSNDIANFLWSVMVLELWLQNNNINYSL